MSFSKTSIFCLILLMAFVVAPAMAHDPLGTLATHSHPTAGVDLNGDGDMIDTGVNGVDEVSAHNTHPKVVSITLKSHATRVRGNMVVITADTDGDSSVPAPPALGNNQFILIVDFNIDIGTGLGGLATDEFSFKLLNATKTTEIDDGDSTDQEVFIDSVTPVSGDASKFEVRITIDPESDDGSTGNTATTNEAIPNGTADDPLEKLFLRIVVDENAVVGIAGQVDSGFGLVTAPGSPNAESAVYTFELVSALPALDTTPPTVAITHVPDDKKALPASGMVTFTFTFNEDIATGEGAFTAKDIDVTGGTKGDFAGAGKVYTLKVTPSKPKDQDVKVTVKAGSVTDDADTPNPILKTEETWEGPDGTPPTVTSITSVPATGEKLPDSGRIDFTFAFSETLGASDAAFQLKDVTITNGTVYNFDAATNTVTVTPIDSTAPVSVTIKADSVLDPSGNALAAAKTAWWRPKDETPPTVTITAVKGSATDSSVTPAVTYTGIVFTFTFSEELGTSPTAKFTSEDITRSTGVDLVSNVIAVAAVAPATAVTVYKVVTTEAPVTRLTVRASTVADPSGNLLVGDQGHTYKPAGIPPSTVPVVTISNTVGNSEGYPNQTYLDSDSDTQNVITVKITDDVGIVDKLTASGITVTNATLRNFDLTETSATSHTATFNVMPKRGMQAVTITVKAGAVKDGHTPKQGNVVKTKVFEVAPLITITVPAREYVIIARERHYVPWSSTAPGVPILSDQPTLSKPAGLPTPAPDHAVVTWEHMPDLKVLFERDGTGEGGGALLLKSAHSQNPDNPLKWGDVIINEIMWATDDGILGHRVNDEQAKQQWIELHNTSSTPAKVFIYARTRRDIVTNTDGKNGRSDVTHPPGDVLDVVTNYFDGSEGIPGWHVPGKDGNSLTGLRADGTTPADFVSMMRIGNDKDGRRKAHWKESVYAYYVTQTTHADQARQIYSFVGTPGRVNTFGPSRQPYLIDKTTDVPSSPIVINEVGNRSNADRAYEWIELRNTSGNDVNLQHYKISIVTGVDQHKELYTFGGSKTTNGNTIYGNGVLLLVASDPRNNDDHPISVGYNIDLPASQQVRGLGDKGLGDGPNLTAARYKVTPFKENLPDNGQFVLILHQSIPHGNGTRAANLATSTSPGEYHHVSTENGVKRYQLRFVMDIAGYHPNLTKNPYHNRVSKTDLWPLTSFGSFRFSNNALGANTVHYRRHIKPNKGGAGAGAWDNNNGKTALADAGFTGLGYKRGVIRSNVLGGTPGYHNDAVKNQLGQLTGEVVISEIMLSQGPGPANRKLPQWLELHNTSKTEAVNLAADAGWRLIIEMPSTDTTIGAFKTINFKAKGNVKVIEPNESILVVSGRARSFGSSTHLRSSIIFPITRVYNVWQEQRNDFGMGTNQLAPILPLEGFHIKLVDGKGALSDEIGNIDGHNRTSWYRDIPEWAYPDSVTEAGYRSSLIRIYDNGMPRNGVSMDKSNVIPLGDKSGKRSDLSYAWVHAADTGPSPFYAITHKTWWGIETDHGTPIQRANAPLPVELSSFQPTLEDGKVVIRWTTESEKDNAGFNIYRSETRGGEFKQVNAQLVEGAGTTGERNTYEWVDTTAKPDVVYYYQIEDVSFSGERQTLAESRLRGYVSAKNKLTTRWGELKKTLQ